MPTYDTQYARGEFINHGEDWLLRRLKGKLNTILDVGSNIGEWSRMARELHPYAEIHTFEVVPETYRRLLQNITIDAKIIPNGFGLSNKCGIMPIKWRKDYDAVSTFLPKLAVENFEWRNGIVFTGDEYVDSRRIDHIDFLKIDVEGAEGLVLEGFNKTLSEGRVSVIQFEYGLACILTKWMLIDAYEMLTPLGYKLGKLTPNGIQFHDYALYHETFNGPDYVAVHNSSMLYFVD
jgi:FkbM family methyltransferase